MRLSNRLLGFAALAAGAVILILAMLLPAPVTGAHITYGPAFFPALIGAALLACGATIAVFPATAEDEPVIGEEEEAGPVTWGGLLLSLASGLAYLYLSDTVGFIILTTVILTTMLAYGGMAVWRAAVTGLVVSVAVYLIFAKGLLVPLPRGILSSWSA